MARWIAAFALLLVLGLACLAATPWGLFKGRIESRLSQTIGRPVTIGTMERMDAMSFHPRLRLTDIRVPQPAWVRVPLDDLARVGQVEIRFSVWSLLAGHLAIEQADVSRASLQFYRTAQGRKNWTDGQSSSGDHASLLKVLKISATRLRYRDDKRDRSLDVAVAADGAGVRLDGTGVILGHGVRVTGRGAPMVGGPQPGPWPYAITIESPAVGFAMQGTMPSPLDIGHLQGQAKGHALDLKLLDAIIEAGLPGTQPVTLTASVQRHWPDWTISRLDGTMGRSDLHGHAIIAKRNGRTRITGALWADHFDVDDLSSNRGKARAKALRAKTGPRLLPASAIDLSHLRRTDGTLDLRVDHLLWPGSSPFRSLSGHVSLDHGRLAIRPLMLGLTHGTMSGAMIIDQTNTGQRDPLLTLDLTLRGGRLLDMFPRANIDGSMTGRLHVAGRGHRLRDAFAVGDGTIALLGREGQIPARTAALLGQDLGGGLTAGKQDLASLRCMVVRLDLRHGIARPGPVIIDTSRGQTQVTGSIALTDERLSLLLHGMPKGKALLRLPGQVPINGTIRQPDIRVPHRAKTVGGVIGMVAKAITGQQGPRAQDADCATLAARALR